MAKELPKFVRALFYVLQFILPPVNFLLAMSVYYVYTFLFVSAVWAGMCYCFAFLSVPEYNILIAAGISLAIIVAMCFAAIASQPNDSQQV